MVSSHLIVIPFVSSTFLPFIYGKLLRRLRLQFSSSTSGQLLEDRKKTFKNVSKWCFGTLTLTREPPQLVKLRVPLECVRKKRHGKKAAGVLMGARKILRLATGPCWSRPKAIIFIKNAKKNIGNAIAFVMKI